MPKIDIRSDAKPATFAYPDMLEEKKSKEKEKVETAVLSTTAKQLGKLRNNAETVTFYSSSSEKPKSQTRSKRDGG
jgi:26S proteasome regulatory subunit N2